jgi:hypothetical protein
MSQGDGYVTITLKRTDLGPIVSGLGLEAERWAKRARSVKPNGEKWSDAVKRASYALEVKERVLKLAEAKLAAMSRGAVV